MNEYMKDAVPEGWQLVPKEPTPEMLAGGWGYWLNVMAPGKQRDTAAKEYTAMLAAAPAPDHFRDATKMMADSDPLHLSRILHELAGAASLCWEPRPTGVFDSQLAIQFVEQALAEIRSRMTPAPAEVPMPKPDRVTQIGDKPRFYSHSADQLRKYGAACRAAGEAAGYARVLEWAVSSWKDEVENRPLENKNRRPLDDVWRQVVRFAGGDPDALLGPSHDAALCEEVKS